MGVEADFDLIERLRLSPGVRVSVGTQGFVFMNSTGTLVLQPAQSSGFQSESIPKNLNGSRGTIEFSDKEIVWQIRRGAGAVSRQPGREVFDADRVGRRIVLRHWQPGDRFQPIGLPRPAKLQDLFTNARIPRDERRRLLVAVSEGGEIFWVERLRIGERFKVTSSTNRRLLWCWKPR